MKRIKVGRELNNVLGQTARNMFVYGLLATIGILFNKVIKRWITRVDLDLMEFVEQQILPRYNAFWKVAWNRTCTKSY